MDGRERRDASSGPYLAGTPRWVGDLLAECQDRIQGRLGTMRGAGLEGLTGWVLEPFGRDAQVANLARPARGS
ncbi:hypothetical protein CERSUDRAFT_87419 [Gelatoporia subvermispora B]|uniref:Uncharacterized protein n=1 Tax=Ceriporiopsis subvermispora (strain B) TaxID=914234 RepID=M2QLQ8_CERS8|nr:hypothetical protein CERSUDRAFT_87419 [Gelatoporia subvermispora B]